MGLGVLLAAGGAPVASGATSVLGPQTFSYTGGEQRYVVPAGVLGLSIVAVGAPGGFSGTGGGGDAGGSTGGLGARVSTVLSVHAGEVLYIEVGGPGGNPPQVVRSGSGQQPGGSGGFNGGGSGGPSSLSGGAPGAGGGGATDVRTVSCGSPCSPADPRTLGSRLLVAGGGGGAGNEGQLEGAGGAGGDAGQLGHTGISGSGTEGVADGGTGGTGGTADSGGAPGQPPCPDAAAGPAMAGVLGAGGGGATGSLGAGGGGGGGFYGGGGGGDGLAAFPGACGSGVPDSYPGGGGGGGGSSFGPLGASFSQDPSGSPQVVLTPLLAAGPTTTFSTLAHELDFDPVLQSYRVPQPAVAVRALAVGAPGGRGLSDGSLAGGNGGLGASVSAALATSPGEDLLVNVGRPGGTYIPVGCRGCPPGGGGQGGGASDIRTARPLFPSGEDKRSEASRLLVAGGGGGGGLAGATATGGAGGDAGLLGAPGSSGGGALGGGGGGGGGADAGGFGGISACTDQTQPGSGAGWLEFGSGSDFPRFGGGGGDGLYGGGEGAEPCPQSGQSEAAGGAGGGGGGSSYGPPGAVFTTAGASGPSVAITPLAPAAQVPARFEVSAVHGSPSGTITLTVRIPGPGQIDVLETAPDSDLVHAAGSAGPGRFVFARSRLRPAKAGQLTVTVHPSSEGRSLISRHRHAILINLWIKYSPTGGVPGVKAFFGVPVQSQGGPPILVVLHLRFDNAVLFGDFGQLAIASPGKPPVAATASYNPNTGGFTIDPAAIHFPNYPAPGTDSGSVQIRLRGLAEGEFNATTGQLQISAHFLIDVTYPGEDPCTFDTGTQTYSTDNSYGHPGKRFPAGINGFLLGRGAFDGAWPSAPATGLGCATDRSLGDALGGLWISRAMPPRG